MRVNSVVWGTLLAAVHAAVVQVADHADQLKITKKPKPNRHNDENNPEHWRRDAGRTLKSKLERTINTNRAKNVIMFLGDGMSVATIAATRAYIGHKLGLLGEEVKLSFEGFPNTGLSKTYCVDKQVADSACSATAYLCGVKGNYGTIGLSGAAKRGVCAAQRDESNRVDSVAATAQKAGLNTGVVTTTRLSHASPAGVYAHTAERGWEADTDMGAALLEGCQDITTQLVTGTVGSQLKVAMGGGRKNFYPKNSRDPEGFPGYRSDNKDLVAEWLKMKAQSNSTPAYVYDKKGLMNLDLKKYDSILGLFEPDHMQYRLDMNTEEDPTLREMTIKALQLLEHNNPNGYFLFVEGGRIDMAHHETKAHKALSETSEFSLAVDAALRIIDLNETLVLVTADHSHTMTYNGYNKRGSDVLGISQIGGSDGVPYTTLSYANGPGYRQNDFNGRYNVLNDDIESINFMFPALVPLPTETHGGEDVAMYANGPWSHLFDGNWEQSFIPHALQFAMCLGSDVTACDVNGDRKFAGSSNLSRKTERGKI